MKATSQFAILILLTNIGFCEEAPQPIASDSQIKVEQVRQRLAQNYPLVEREGVQSFLVHRRDHSEILVPAHFDEKYARYLEHDAYVDLEPLLQHATEGDFGPPVQHEAIFEPKLQNSPQSSLSVAPITALQSPAQALTRSEPIPSHQALDASELGLPDFTPMVVPQDALRKPRVGKRFWVLVSALMASTILDVESTTSGVSRGCSEANPIVRLLLGSHPSRLGMYSTSMGLNVAVVVAVNQLKKRHHASNADLISLTPATAAHTFAGIHNLLLACH
jgi:hypothetical protein